MWKNIIGIVALLVVVLACGGVIDLSFYKARERIAHGHGFVLPVEFRLPGTVVARNITPDRETGIGAWTDREKISAIREGIGCDGRRLFPMMLYSDYHPVLDPRDRLKYGEYRVTLGGCADCHPQVNRSGRIPKKRFNYPTTTIIMSQLPVRNAVETDPGQPTKL